MPRGSLHDVEFRVNPESRCPCVLLLDTSGSMEGDRIKALNRGLRAFRDDLQRDSLTAKRVEVAVVTFNSQVRVVRNFVTADAFKPPTLTASGETYMAGGIERALHLIRARTQRYARNGIPYYRPWIFMITDGKPEGEPDAVVARATRRVHEYEARRRVAFFVVGVEGADMRRLSRIAVRTPLELEALNFEELFLWLSASMQAVSTSHAGDEVKLPPMSWLKRISLFIEDHEGAINGALRIAGTMVKLAAL